MRKVGDILPHKTQEWHKISAPAGTVGVSGSAGTVGVSEPTGTIGGSLTTTTTSKE